MGKTIKVSRSSVSGKFVTQKYADAHPKTTENERIKKCLVERWRIEASASASSVSFLLRLVPPGRLAPRTDNRPFPLRRSFPRPRQPFVPAPAPSAEQHDHSQLRVCVPLALPHMPLLLLATKGIDKYSVYVSTNGRYQHGGWSWTWTDGRRAGSR